jgi:hypothetical protein
MEGKKYDWKENGSDKDEKEGPERRRKDYRKGKRQKEKKAFSSLQKETEHSN